MEQAYKDWIEEESFEPSMILRLAFYAGYQESQSKQTKQI